MIFRPQRAHIELRMGLIVIEKNTDDGILWLRIGICIWFFGTTTITPGEEAMWCSVKGILGEDLRISSRFSLLDSEVMKQCLSMAIPWNRVDNREPLK